MSNPIPATRVAHLVDPHGIESLDVLGPTIQVLTEPGADDGSPCVMRGTIPPGVAVPLHSHPDPETFILLSGEAGGSRRRMATSAGPGSSPAASSTSQAGPSTPGGTGRGNWPS